MKDWNYFWHVSAIFCAMWEEIDYYFNREWANLNLFRNSRRTKSESCMLQKLMYHHILGVKLNSRCFWMKTKSFFIVYGTLYFSYDLCPSFTQKMDCMPVEIFAIWGNPFIDPFFDILKRLEMLCPVNMHGENGAAIESNEYYPLSKYALNSCISIG